MPINLNNSTWVTEFINAETKEWRIEMVNDTFPSEIALKILQILLAGGDL